MHSTWRRLASGRRLLFAVVLVAGCITPAPVVSNGRYAILPPSKAGELLDQCSRPTPETAGTWPMTEADAEQLERDLPKVLRMTAAECCMRGGRVADLDYFRQYAGVTINGRRFIYVNAFPASAYDGLPPGVKLPDWRQEPFKACDGGSAYWGVLYDPATRRFSQLALNGLG